MKRIRPVIRLFVAAVLMAIVGQGCQMNPNIPQGTLTAKSQSSAATPTPDSATPTPAPTSTPATPTPVTGGTGGTGGTTGTQGTVALPTQGTVALPVATVAVNVLIGYTPAVAATLGGAMQAQALAAQMVNRANQIMMNSRVNLKFTLTATSQTSSNGPGSATGSINQLIIPGDGVYDELFAARTLTKVDVVSVIAVLDGVCGVAGGINPDRANAFTVVDPDCESTRFTYAHELGHIFGAQHEPEVAGVGPQYAADGYAHVDKVQKFRTVMGYAVDQPDNVRIGVFSHPTVTYKTYPVGVLGKSNNSRVVGTNMTRVSNLETLGDLRLKLTAVTKTPMVTAQSPGSPFMGNNCAAPVVEKITGKWRGLTTIVEGFCGPKSFLLTNGVPKNEMTSCTFSGANERIQTNRFTYDGKQTITVTVCNGCTIDKCGSAGGGGPVTWSYNGVYQDSP